MQFATPAGLPGPAEPKAQPGTARPTRRAVKRLSLVRDDSGAPLRISSGGLSVILLGRLHFAGGGSRRVAVKRLRSPIRQPEAERLRRCIDDLERAGVRLPPMHVHPLDESEWVVVSPLYGSRSRGSKLSQKALFFRDAPGETRRFAVEDLTRVANAGYTPALDLFLFIAARPWQWLPMDLDLIVKAPGPRCASALARCIAQISEQPAERRVLLEVSRRLAAPWLRTHLEPLFDDSRSPFRPYWEG